MQGGPLPVDDADAEARGFDEVLTEWDSELFGIDVHLRTMIRDRWVVHRLPARHQPRRHRGRALRPRRGSRCSGSTGGTTPPCAAAPRRPGGRPVGLPARGPGRPAGARGTGVSARRRAAGYRPGPWPGEDGGPRRLGAPAAGAARPGVGGRHAGRRRHPHRPGGDHGGHPRPGRALPAPHTAWATTRRRSSSGSTRTPWSRWRDSGPTAGRAHVARRPGRPRQRVAATWCSATTPTGSDPTSRPPGLGRAARGTAPTTGSWCCPTARS